MTGSFDLTGRVVVVTGGSRGLGRAMTEAFARHGADVVLASRKLQSCVEAAEAISTATGRRALGVQCHVGRWEDCDRLVDAVYEEFGRIDVLVNNAGVAPRYSSLPQVSEAMFDKVIEVNLKGTFRLSATTGSRMADQGGGSIINVSSVSAVTPTPMELPYAAAKAGVNSLTVGFARAFAPKVRVNCIMAGPFLTDISLAWTPEFRDAANAAILLGRAGQPTEVVGAALYLASEASSFTTGAIIRVDGGMAAAAP